MSVGYSQPVSDREVITVGGGCFWCIEAVFAELKGVEKAESGYSGGQTANPSYREVCGAATGHAEVVEITFNPKIISLKEILDVFFIVHDPTTLNRQGADVGTQYRSVIYYRTPQQKLAAEQSIQSIEQAKLWGGKIVTEIAPFKVFYKAEDYHQQYYQLNGSAPYCQAVIDPKIAKFRQLFANKLKNK